MDDDLLWQKILVQKLIIKLSDVMGHNGSVKDTGEFGLYFSNYAPNILRLCCIFGPLS